MSTAACFENIIGLSRAECDCVGAAPDGANVSQSGLYLDELDGVSLQMFEAKRDCGQGGIWDILERARENAIEETKAELMACLSANTDRRRQPGLSQIGDDKKVTSTNHALRSAYHGVTLQTAKVKGGIFKVTAIGTAFKAASNPGTITLNVYQRVSNVDGEVPVATYVLPTTGDRVVWTEIEPLELSMDEFGLGNPRYWFLYEPVEGLRAMDSRINCNCGGFKPSWNVNNPQYASPNQKGGMLWADWSMAAGTKGTNLDDRDEWTVENATQGILLRVQFDCDESSSFCADAPDYVRDPIQKVIAHAVRFKAGANLMTALLSSTNINRYTMTAGEVLEENRRRYEKEFAARVLEYICPTLAEEGNINRYGDCLKCKDRWGLSRGTIRN